MLMRRLFTGFISAMISATALAGCSLHSHTASPYLGALSRIRPSGNSPFWLQPDRHHILWANLVTVRGHQLLVQQSATPAYPHGFMQTLKVTAQTRLWMNGGFRPFTPSAVAPGESLAVLITPWPRTWPDSQAPVAETIYGPQQQVYGIITSIHADIIDIRVIRWVAPGPRAQYTGQREQLMYNADSNFGGVTPADLTPGDMVQAQIVGESGRRLVETLILSRRGKAIGPGAYQWIPVSPDNGDQFGVRHHPVRML